MLLLLLAVVLYGLGCRARGLVEIALCRVDVTGGRIGSGPRERQQQAGRVQSRKQPGDLQQINGSALTTN